MKQKKISKALSLAIASTIVFTNFFSIGLTSKTYAIAEGNLETQDVQTNSGNIEFDAFYMNNNQKTHEIEKELNNSDLELCLYTNVKKGYIKNAKIQIKGENNTKANIKLQDNQTPPELVETIDKDNNQIILKQLNTGTNSTFKVKVDSIKDDKYDISKAICLLPL